MANLSSLLVQGAAEIRQYSDPHFDQQWLDRMAGCMESAAELSGAEPAARVGLIQAIVEMQIPGLTHFVDSPGMTNMFMGRYMPTLQNHNP